ncbi:ABC transporter substrate-binding protein [Peribacillus saganii]|uniref:ABC transporter substrate-binding protein n=1 Tax=Peribacillus saganii TaxID=2303992 RepID=A0A372LL39_9BACI|nr:ABC transporter substrate-binding protein [Peribacillus saganii]
MGEMELKVRKIGIMMVVLSLMFALFGCTQESKKTSKTTDDGGKTLGGELQVAINTQPPTIDPHMSSVSMTSTVARHIIEPLVTINSKYEPVPMLAKSWEISQDGKTYTFPLREGVKFHNGKELVAEDVVASMRRWLEKSTLAQTALAGATFEAKDKFTVLMQVEKPSVFAIYALAGMYQFAGIMPKEVVEAATEIGVEEYIGTGPFKFVEWKQDQYIHLAKYEDYNPVDSPADGLGGRKEALVDNLYLQFVVDSSTRLAGLLSEEYDIGYAYEYDMLEQLENNPNLNVENPYFGPLALLFNKNQGLFSDVKMRQAVNAILDNDKIAKASLGKKYRLDSSYATQELSNWYSEAGAESYNKPDLEKAKRLLKEAGYNGETIRLITSRDYSYIYDSATAIKEQLSKAGMKVELEVYDFATVIAKSFEPTKWELFSVGFAARTTPLEQEWFNSKYATGPLDQKSEDLIKQLRGSTSQEDAKKLWDELQAYSWEFLPIIKIADYSRITASSKKVEGLKLLDGPILWNTTIAK